MKVLYFCAVLTLFPNVVLATDNPRCAQKSASLQHEIEAARAAGHDRKAEGMATALAKLQANCTDEKLVRERRQAVAEAQAKVSERSAELEAEKAEGGGGEKIAKRQAKLEEAQAELRAAEAALAH